MNEDLYTPDQMQRMGVLHFLNELGIKSKDMVKLAEFVTYGKGSEQIAAAVGMDALFGDDHEPVKTLEDLAALEVGSVIHDASDSDSIEEAKVKGKNGNFFTVVFHEDKAIINDLPWTPAEMLDTSEFPHGWEFCGTAAEDLGIDHDDLPPTDDFAPVNG